MFLLILMQCAGGVVPWNDCSCWRRGEDVFTWQDLQGPVVLPTDFLCGTGKDAETQGIEDIIYLRFMENEGARLLNGDTGLGPSTSRWMLW